MIQIFIQLNSNSLIKMLIISYLISAQVHLIGQKCALILVINIFCLTFLENKDYTICISDKKYLVNI